METMLRDYRPKKPVKLSSKNQNKSQSVRKSGCRFDHKWLVSFVLVALIILLTFLAVKIELTKFYRLKTNERVLLLKNQKPIAYLFFNIEDKQLTVTDLQELNFNADNFDQLSSMASESSKTLFYAFLFNTMFDHSYEYSSSELNKKELLTFFKDQKSYYFFLQDEAVLWREQKFNPKNFVLVEPIFNCPVAIINTTTETGLATSLANMLEKSAFSIIKRDSNTDSLERTKIVYNTNEPSCTYLIDKLNKVFPPSVLIADETETLNHRAALVIYIGQDLANLYNFFVSKNLPLTSDQ